jgi:hypothetical protein
MVMVWVPVLAGLATVIFIFDVPEPGAPMDVGLKLTVTPDDSPDADKEIAESKLPETVVVIVEVPELPQATVSEAGDVLMLKSPLLAELVTVKATLVVCVTPPPEPVTVMVYVPVAVVEGTVKVRVEVPEPGAAMDEGLKPTVTPLGWPVADRAIALLNPPETAVVIVEVPLLPCTTETELGEAEMVKLGAELVPASALISPAPLGLPQPVAKSYPFTAG